MYEEFLPESVKIIDSDSDWELEDLDVMGRGELTIGKIEEKTCQTVNKKM